MRLLHTLLRDERVRFVLVGGFNTVFAFALFVVFELIWPGLYLLSLFLSYAIAVLVAFGLHRRVTFRVEGRERVLLDFARFVSVYVVMFAVNAALLPLFIEVLGWNTIVAQGVATVVTTVLSYTGHKLFSFRRPA